MVRRPRIVRSRRTGLSRYLGDDEQVLLVTRQHPFVLVRAAIDTFGLLLPLAIAAWGIAGTELLRGSVGTWLLRLVFVVMLVLLAKLAWRVLAWEFERVMVTVEKVIHVAGVLDKRSSSGGSSTTDRSWWTSRAGATRRCTGSPTCRTRRGCTGS
jgi:hypothetical protein